MSGLRSCMSTLTSWALAVSERGRSLGCGFTRLMCRSGWTPVRVAGGQSRLRMLWLRRFAASRRSRLWAERFRGRIETSARRGGTPAVASLLRAKPWGGRPQVLPQSGECQPRRSISLDEGDSQPAARAGRHTPLRLDPRPDRALHRGPVVARRNTAQRHHHRPWVTDATAAIRPGRGDASPSRTSWISKGQGAGRHPRHFSLRPGSSQETGSQARWVGVPSRSVRCGLRPKCRSFPRFPARPGGPSSSAGARESIFKRAVDRGKSPRSGRGLDPG